MSWREPALIPTKYYENKTVCVFFQGASDANAKIRRNISQKFKNNEQLNFWKIRFSKIDEKMDLDQVIYTVFHAEFESGSRIGPKPPQDPIFKDFLKIMIFIKIRFLSIFIGAAASAGGPF